MGAPDVPEGVEQLVPPHPDPVGHGQQQVLDRQVLVAHVGPQASRPWSSSVAQGAVDARLRPADAGGSRARASPIRCATTAGSTPTRVRTGPAMPSAWSSTAASTWSGVTSA